MLLFDFFLQNTKTMQMVHQKRNLKVAIMNDTRLPWDFLTSRH